MSAVNPLARRIKKYITSREHEFFAITAPQLEKICQKELNLILPQNKTFVQQGGVTFLGRLESMYTANLYLRSATRILMRIGNFKASNFIEFTKKLARLNFKFYFNEGCLPEITVATHHCRLHHSNALKEIAAEVLAEFFHLADDKICIPSLYIRGTDDHFVVSLDTSGDMLYKRGLKTLGAQAPLRETLAYAILQQAGYQGGPLIDPMCGSGTFSLEAASSAGNIAPGLLREFAFMHTPFFNAPQWEYLKKTAHAQKLPPPAEPFIWASDLDADNCNNLKNAIKAQELANYIQVEHKDFFDTQPGTHCGDQKGLVVLNPPYGIRLLERAEAARLYADISRKLKADYTNWRFAIITPHKDWLNLKISHWYKIWHGGLNLFLAVGDL